MAEGGQASDRKLKDLEVYAPVPINSAKSLVGPNLAARQALYKTSIDDPAAFWGSVASRDFYWQQPFSTVRQFNFDTSKGPIDQKWFEGGVTNVCYNAVDRHLETHRDRIAFFWEGNEVGENAQMTYGQLYDEVVVFSSVLRSLGVTKGSRVSLYLPMILLGPIAMLSCARIGAVCSVVFGGFSAASLASRLIDSSSTVLVTAESTMRGDKLIPLKSIVDEALASCEAQGLKVKTIVYERHSRAKVPMVAGRDEWYKDLADKTISAGKLDARVEWVQAEDPLFMLYTSGSTGKPKGVVHTTAGYMVYAATTFKYTFDYHLNDVYFCTADIGWITGHTYITYGPLLNAATSVIFEGVPNYPNPSRWWEIVDRFKVTQFYTAPTAIRALMKFGSGPVKTTKRSTIRVLGSVGEPINREAWKWYYDVVGEGRADIVDTWWQTETGGIMITPLPGNTPQKPGSATLPFFGIVPVLLDPKTNTEIEGVGEGLLMIKYPWPGMARTIYGDHKRYEQVYFPINKYYMTGDGARRDEDGYFWLTGRVDDVVNVSGHRLGTSEIESAINSNPNVVESAVVGIPHELKGEAIYAYVTFKPEVKLTQAVIDAVKATVRKEIGPLAVPDAVHPAPGLPKTRSGKIMRRILRKIAVNALDDLGDITTLADPNVVTELIELKKEWVDKKSKKKGTKAKL